MKVQKQFVNKRGDKIYHKYVVVISPEIIEKSGFKEGDNLEADAKRGEIKFKMKKI